MVRSSKSPARVTSNHEEKASTRSSPSGRPDRTAVDRTDLELVLGQLDDQCHAPRRRPGSVGPGPLGRR